MVGNRIVVVCLLALSALLAGCSGASFTADLVEAPDADADAGPAVDRPDSGAVDPLKDVVAPPADGGVAADRVVTEDGGASVADAGDADADGKDSGATTQDGGVVVVDAGGAGEDAAQACNQTYVHHVGLMNLTWSDCTPTDTYDSAQALAACAAYAVANGTAASACTLNAEPMAQGICGSTVTVTANGTEAVWLYHLYSGQRGAVGHVATGGTCPGMQDSIWD